MNIYLLTRNSNKELDWDEYRGFVLSAKDLKGVKDLIDPFLEENDWSGRGINITDFNVELIGYKIDSKSEIILCDFNQG